MEKEYKIIFNKPAKNSNFGWERQSIHIGNSYMGSSIYGRYDEEILQLNEKSLWTGGPSKNRENYLGGNFQSDNFFEKIKKSLNENDNDNIVKYADNLIGLMDGYGCYQNFGEILLKFNHKNVKNYKRYLDISNSIAVTEYISNSNKYFAEHFASYKDNVIVSKFTSENKNLNLEIAFNRSYIDTKVIYTKDFIEISGEVSDNQLKYFGKILIQTDGIKEASSILTIKEASYVILYINIATDYKNEYPKYRQEDPENKVNITLEKAFKKGYEKLKEDHIIDYKSLFNNNKISLSKNSYDLNTKTILNKYKLNIISNDLKNYLYELLYQYGRYLIISSSRKNTLPANLQGVWNNSNNPKWGCDYHININLQMCYFPVYKTNLVQCSEPLIEYINSLVKPGNITYKTYFKKQYEKDNRGWVCHTQNTPFGWTCPGWEFNWGWSPACSGWIMKDVYDYYQYTQDKEFLKNNIYNTLKESALFYLNTLILDEKNNRYVSCPAYSPEHGPITLGNTYENIIIQNLFILTKEAALILNDDKDFIDRLDKYINKLKPIEIGKWNQIKEWYEEDEWYKNKYLRRLHYKKHQVQMGHRHISHLLFVYPLCNFDRNNKNIINAVKTSLKDRRKYIGYLNDTGWSKMNKALINANIKDKKAIKSLINSFIKHNIANNLVDLHPPFQLDGNCGFTDLIAEMLLHSNNEYIELLPSLTDNFKYGYVKGLLAKKGYEVDIYWKENKITKFDIRSDKNDYVNIYINEALEPLFKGKLNQIIKIKIK